MEQNLKFGQDRFWEAHPAPQPQFCEGKPVLSTKRGAEWQSHLLESGQNTAGMWVAGSGSWWWQCLWRKPECEPGEWGKWVHAGISPMKSTWGCTCYRPHVSLCFHVWVSAPLPFCVSVFCLCLPLLSLHNFHLHPTSTISRFYGAYLYLFVFWIFWPLMPSSSKLVLATLYLRPLTVLSRTNLKRSAGLPSVGWAWSLRKVVPLLVTRMGTVSRLGFVPSHCCALEGEIPTPRLGGVNLVFTDVSTPTGSAIASFPCRFPGHWTSLIESLS